MAENPPASVGDTRDTGSIPGSRRYPGVGNGNPLQYSCLENYMDRGAWWATVHGVTKSQTWLSDWAQSHFLTYKVSVLYTTVTVLEFGYLKEYLSPKFSWTEPHPGLWPLQKIRSYETQWFCWTCYPPTLAFHVLWLPGTVFVHILRNFYGAEVPKHSPQNNN